MKYHLTCVLLFLGTMTLAQRLTVLSAKRAFLDDSKIVRSDTLAYNQTITIKPHGIIELQGNSSKNLVLREGTYNLGNECFKHVSKHLKHDKIHQQLDSLGFLNCNFDYDYILIGPNNRHGSTKRIEIQKAIDSENLPTDFIAIIDSRINSSLPIYWEDFNKEYSGSYFILIQDVYQTYQDLIKINSNSYILNLSKQKTDQSPLLSIKIFSEDCRETDTNIIGLFPPKSHSSHK